MVPIHETYSAKWFAVVMKGYANRQNPKALKIMEDMISALEDEQLVQAKSSASPVLDCNTYNILLNAYIQVLGEQAVPYIRTTLDRMQTISKRIDDASLLPDLACYATLMKALLLQCQPGFDLDQVKEVLTQLLADIQSSEKQAHDRMKADVKAMDAWSKSGDSQAAKKARQIFDAMDKPNSSAYNVLCNIYIAIGKLDEVFRLYERMQTHYSSGENKECRPDMHTNSTILKALQKSNRPDATEKAEQIFNSISSPNTVVYNTLLNIYAHTGNVDKALVLFSEMESKYRSGANKNCRPDMHTHATMLNALQKSNREDSIEKAEQIVSRISSPDTVIYTTLLNFYAKHGNVEKALALVREMQSDFDTGKNKNCRPNMRTYATVLNALQKSNVSNAADQAEQIFNSISSPNTIVYNTLLNIYARRGMGQTAVALTRRMQVDFDSGTNRDCRPDDMTETTLWKALDTAKDRRTLEEDGRDVLEWFRKRPNRS
jgi:pentatricopeptide repeat protein